MGPVPKITPRRADTGWARRSKGTRTCERSWKNVSSNNKVELSLREVLGIAKEFHDSIVDLVKRKRLSTETEPEKPVEVRTTHIEDMALEDEVAESHYSRPHWARATTETPP